MSRIPKGFAVSLPTFSRNHEHDRAISFQLKPDGVRYFFVVDRSGMKTDVRDISTQYRSLAKFGGLWLGDEETPKIRQRLKEHAQLFYPEFVIPGTLATDSYSWVAFPMIGAAMKQKPSLQPPFGVNLQVAAGLRAFTVRDMTATIFGEAPKQLQSAVAASLVKEGTFVNIDNLTLASLLRGYLPPNSMADVLRMNLLNGGVIQQTDKLSANNIRMLLRRFNPHRIMRLIQSLAENTHGEMLLRDAANQYADARKNHPDTVMDLSRQFRSMGELHESVSREYRKLAYVNQTIGYSTQLTEELESIELPDGAKLIWPSCTHELMDWAAEMSNCIYAYGKEAAIGRCLLFAVLDSSGKMLINIMVRGKNVVQCYGKANQTVTDEVLLKAVFEGLVDADIVSPENEYFNWTGRNRRFDVAY